MNSKKLFLTLAAALAAAGVLTAQDAVNAASIVDRSRNRIEASTIQTQSRMVITSKSGSVTERVMDQYSKDDASGNNRSMLFFRSPASIAGTRFLTMENAGKDDDRWIFLPSTGKRRRIASSEGSSSFVSTDFSYDDVSSQDRNADLDNHRLLREEKFRDADCYVIESTPKDPGYQYSKMIHYIDKGNFVNYKIELYDRRGNQVKLLEILDLKDVQGRLTPMATKMTTLAAGTSTTINVNIIRYDENIPEGVFTTAFLETGRPGR
jgi:outer membrane lipoprotein-sorting protein